MAVSLQKLFHQKSNNKLFIHGGPGSGFQGHKGRKGKVGGSSKEGSAAPAETYEEKVQRFREHSGLGAYPSYDPDDPYDAKHIDFHGDMATAFENRLDPAQMRSIQAYTDGDYGRINKGLRNTEIGYDKLDEYGYPDVVDRVDNIDSTFELDEAVLRENIVLFRGTQLDKEDRAQVIASLKLAKNPNTRVFYDDLGYFSASTSEYQAKTFGSVKNDEKLNVFFEVQMPKGSTVIPIGETLSDFPEEEMILPRGSRFEILHYTEEEEDMPNSMYNAKVVMRYIP
jgi:hypothetical protein